MILAGVELLFIGIALLILWLFGFDVRRIVSCQRGCE
jgi:hypothetical protein